MTSHKKPRKQLRGFFMPVVHLLECDLRCAHAKNALVTGDVTSDEVGLQRQLRVDVACQCRINRHPSHGVFKYRGVGFSRPLRWARLRTRTSKPFNRCISWLLRLQRMLHHGPASGKHASVHVKTPNAACAQAHCLVEFGAATAFATAHFLKFPDLTFSPFFSKESGSISHF